MLTRENGFTLPFPCKFPDAKKYAFTFVTLFVALVAIYSNSFYGEWHFDDFSNIVDNPNIKIKSISGQDVKQFLSGIGGLPSRPLPNLTFALNHALGELNVFGFHVVNFFIHYLAAVFLFLFIYNTLKLPRLKDQYENIAYPVALLAAFFWAVHPVWVTSVTYIVQRMTSMAGMFYILSMYFYLKARTTEKAISIIGFFIACALAGAGAVLSKENAFMLPVSLLLLDLFLIQGINKKNVKKSFIILLIPCVLIFILGWFYTGGLSNVMAGYEIRNFSLTERLLTEPRVILFYLSLLFYPIGSRLTLLYDIEISRSLFSPWTTLPALALVLLIIGFAFYLSRKRPLISFCILFYFLNHLIEGTIIPLELVFEHRNYVPAMLLFVPVAHFIINALDYFSYRKTIQVVVALGIAIILFGLGDNTSRRNAIFSSEILLCLDNTDKYPALSRPYTNLGIAHIRHQKYDEGLQNFQKALLLNNFSNAHQRAIQEYNVGVFYFKAEKYDLAFPHFKNVYEIIPSYVPNTVNLAKLYVLRDDFPAARRLIEPLIETHPDNYILHEIYTLILLKENDLEKADFFAKRFLHHNSSGRFPYAVLAEISRRRGNIKAAILYWRIYQETAPQDICANLASIELYSQTKDDEKLKMELNKLYYLKGNRPLASYLEEVSRKRKLFVYFPEKGRIEAAARNKLVCQQ